MSKYYNPGRSRNIFDPESEEPFKLSRSKIELFLNCPRCFYLDRKEGIGRPPGFPFNLNSAVDLLLKKEFDIHRASNRTHPLMRAFGLDLVPFSHPMMDEWRENFKGVQYFYEPADLILTGAVDDIWVDKKGLIYVVDYKATSKDTEVSLDAEWQKGYKNQMEFYQWLLRKNGFKVSNTGYFVYCNGRRDVEAFDGKLEFNIKIIPYEGNDDWVEGIILKAKECLMQNEIPKADAECDYCNYREAAQMKESIQKDLPVAGIKKPRSKKVKIQSRLI
jgi:hypothetical protein